jgi:redox-sensing transcriptional repressor
MSSRETSDREQISEVTTGRLSVYLRCLTYLESIDQRTVSSHELAERFHLNSAQIRKDLACFGEFGTRGVGYNVSRLRSHLVGALGLDRVRNVLVVGAGNLGLALADYSGFNEGGFRIVALVDSDRSKVGQISRSGIPILSGDELPQIVRNHAVDIGVIAVSSTSAQAVHDALIAAGVSAILNFAPIQMRVRTDVKVRSVDLRINLESLSFYLKNLEDGTSRPSEDSDPS